MRMYDEAGSARTCGPACVSAEVCPRCSSVVAACSALNGVLGAQGTRPASVTAIHVGALPKGGGDHRGDA